MFITRQVIINPEFNFRDYFLPSPFRIGIWYVLCNLSRTGTPMSANMLQTLSVCNRENLQTTSYCKCLYTAPFNSPLPLMPSWWRGAVYEETSNFARPCRLRYSTATETRFHFNQFRSSKMAHRGRVENSIHLEKICTRITVGVTVFTDPDGHTNVSESLNPTKLAVRHCNSESSTWIDTL